MKSKIKNKWVAALRSGEFQQGKLALVKNNKYCCLGVLCTLAALEGVCSMFTEPNSESNVVFDETGGVLPTSVEKWAGIKTNIGKYNRGSRSLVLDNDVNDKSFNEIADIIEKHWKEL